MSEVLTVSTNHFEVAFDDCIKTELLEILYNQPAGRDWNQLHEVMLVRHANSEWLDIMMNRALGRLADEGSVVRLGDPWRFRITASQWLNITASRRACLSFSTSSEGSAPASTRSLIS